MLLSLTGCATPSTKTASVAQRPADHKESADLHFGEAVSVVANSALVGSPRGTDGRSAGLAYIFEQTGTGWKRTAALSAKDERGQNGFGSPLAYAKATALVGAWRTGTAYIFERGATGWDQVAILSHSDGGNFGRSVALKQATAIVGAPGVRDTARAVPAWSGAVYIWSKDETGWRYRERITPDSANSPTNLSAPPGPYHLFENFGQELAVHNDVLVVSAHNGTTARGKVYVFRRRNDTWKQEAELQQQHESFGVAIAVTAGTIAVASSGLVFLYTDASGTWTLQGTLEPRVAGEPSGFQYGGPVAIDGNLMVVGAVRYGRRKGAVHVFERAGSSWNQVATLTGNDTRSDSFFGNRSGDLFGGSVSIHGDTIIVGASFHDSEGPNFGAAYVFSREGSQWVQTSKLVPPREPHSSSSQ
jgi:hypothetical protein